MLNIYSGRKRFNTLESVSDILWNMIVGCCPASCRFSREKGSHQRRRFAIANLYKNATERFTEELDIIKLLKSIYQLSLESICTYNNYHQMPLVFPKARPLCNLTGLVSSLLNVGSL